MLFTICIYYHFIYYILFIKLDILKQFFHLVPVILRGRYFSLHWAEEEAES